CIVAVVVYGIVHDQITARICLEYFTVFHPPVFATQSPTLLAIGWGIIATWWAGAIIGTLLAISSRIGSRAKLTAHDLSPMVFRLLLVMAFCAMLFGTIGYFKGTMPAAFYNLIPVARHRRFLADWWAHNASYGSGFLGGIALCVIICYRRIRSASS
ncbi:MAG: hypothetical protein WBE38_05455, partial [Terracidiphilus sp.]